MTQHNGHEYTFAHCEIVMMERRYTDSYDRTEWDTTTDFEAAERIHGYYIMKRADGLEVVFDWTAVPDRDTFLVEGADIGSDPFWRDGQRLNVSELEEEEGDLWSLRESVSDHGQVRLWLEAIKASRRVTV